MLIPIAVLASAELRLPGWSETPDPTPDWWEDTPSGRKSLTQRRKGAKEEEIEERELDSLPPSPFAPLRLCVRSSDWVAALLACPLFAEQKRLGGRAVPHDDVFGGLLAALDGAGGKMTAQALARRLEMPSFRLRGLLAVVQRVLNLEGYAVLGRDESSDTVELNRDLLLRQFDLLAEDRP
jgi:hypothetical protein